MPLGKQSALPVVGQGLSFPACAHPGQIVKLCYIFALVRLDMGGPVPAVFQG